MFNEQISTFFAAFTNLRTIFTLPIFMKIFFLFVVQRLPERFYFERRAFYLLCSKLISTSCMMLIIFYDSLFFSFLFISFNSRYFDGIAEMRSIEGEIVIQMKHIDNKSNWSFFLWLLSWKSFEKKKKKTIKMISDIYLVHMNIFFSQYIFFINNETICCNNSQSKSKDAFQPTYFDIYQTKS